MVSSRRIQASKLLLDSLYGTGGKIWPLRAVEAGESLVSVGKQLLVALHPQHSRFHVVITFLSS